MISFIYLIYICLYFFRNPSLWQSATRDKEEEEEEYEGEHEEDDDDDDVDECQSRLHFKSHN